MYWVKHLKIKQLYNFNNKEYGETIMKNILKYILSLVILFGVVPVTGQEAIVETAQTCTTQEVKECCQIASSEDIKKKKKSKKKKIKKGKKKKKGFFSKVFGSK